MQDQNKRNYTVQYIELQAETHLISYPTPGIMRSTRAVDASIQAISPDCSEGDLAGFSRRLPRMTHFIMDVEVLGERVTSCRTRLIVRNKDGIIELIQLVFQRHDGDWSNNAKGLRRTEG